MGKEMVVMSAYLFTANMSDDIWLTNCNDYNVYYIFIYVYQYPVAVYLAQIRRNRLLVSLDGHFMYYSL